MQQLTVAEHVKTSYASHLPSVGLLSDNTRPRRRRGGDGGLGTSPKRAIPHPTDAPRSRRRNRVERADGSHCDSGEISGTSVGSKCSYLAIRTSTVNRNAGLPVGAIWRSVAVRKSRW